MAECDRQAVRPVCLSVIDCLFSWLTIDSLVSPDGDLATDHAVRMTLRFWSSPAVPVGTARRQTPLDAQTLRESADCD